MLNFKRIVELVAVVVVGDVVVENSHHGVEAIVVDTGHEGREVALDPHLVGKVLVFIFVVQGVLNQMGC